MKQNCFVWFKRIKTFFTVSIEICEIYPNTWGLVKTFDIPKINVSVNIGGRLKVTAFGITVVNLEGTLCLR